MERKEAEVQVEFLGSLLSPRSDSRWEKKTSRALPPHHGEAAQCAFLLRPVLLRKEISMAPRPLVTSSAEVPAPQTRRGGKRKCKAEEKGSGEAKDTGTSLGGSSLGLAFGRFGVLLLAVPLTGHVPLGRTPTRVGFGFAVARCLPELWRSDAIMCLKTTKQ